MRLQVFLSHNGVCSRRKAMEIIAQGRVSVNGKTVTEPSTPVDPAKDTVSVDGQPIKPKAFSYVLMNKPRGVTTTKADRFAEKTITDLLPQELKHLNPVGRLDKDTEGLLLLTNDGELANQLAHPRYDVDKTYVVKVQGELTPEQKQRLETGVVLEGKKTAPAKISNIHRAGDGTEFDMTIHEGRKRQIRLMCDKIGRRVVELKRIRQGPLTLGDLKPGEYRLLTEKEIAFIKEHRNTGAQEHK